MYKWDQSFDFWISEWKKQKNQTEIHREIVEMYDESVILCKQMSVWLVSKREDKMCIRDSLYIETYYYT